MRDLITCLTVAILAFLIGVASIMLWDSHYVAEEIPILQPKPNIPNGWQKIEVESKFSFFLPPDMRKTRPVGCSFWPGDNFANNTLVLGYGYGEGISCRASPYLVGHTRYESSETIVAGRQAMLEIYSIDSGPSELILCFPNSNHDGTVLTLSVSSIGNEQASKLAWQIFNTIEFR